MIALALLFIVFALAILLRDVASMCARRAVPLTLGLMSAWLSVGAELHWFTTVLLGLSGLIVAAVALDYLAEIPSTRPFVVSLEAISGATLCAALLYAVLNSAGVAPLTVWVACACLGSIAALTAVSFRNEV